MDDLKVTSEEFVESKEWKALVKKFDLPFEWCVSFSLHLNHDTFVVIESQRELKAVQAVALTHQSMQPFKRGDKVVQGHCGETATVKHAEPNGALTVTIGMKTYGWSAAFCKLASSEGKSND